jgi:hypothetical protein
VLSESGGYLLRDTFTDANDTQLTNHTMDIGSGWATSLGWWADTQSNQARTNARYCFTDASMSNASAGVEVTLSTSADSSTHKLLGRYTDTTHYWDADIRQDIDQWRIVEMNGTGTLRASGTPELSASGTRTLRLAFSGCTVSACLDGANELSYASASFNASATYFGFHSSGDFRFDNFEVHG